MNHSQESEDDSASLHGKDGESPKKENNDAEEDGAASVQSQDVSRSEDGL
jgi:hypothetical protein